MLTYNQGLQSFKNFRNKYAVAEIWPVPLQDVVCYIADLYKSGLSHSTIKCYISALSFFSKINDLEDCTQKFIVKKLLEGTRRCQGNRKDTRLPITSSLLIDIVVTLPKVCATGFEARLFTAAFTLAFHGLMRVGELAIKKGSKNHTVQFGDVNIFDKYMAVHLASSKTDQLGKGSVIFIPVQVTGPCPVKAMIEYLKVRPPFKGALFCHFDGTELTCFQFSSVLRKALVCLNVDQKHISSHSFRIGKATSCALEGMSDEEIKIAGRWKSKSYQTYIRLPQ